MASDIIGQLSFGESFRLLEAGKVGYADSFQAGLADRNHKNHFIKVLETAAMSITLKNEFPPTLQFLPLYSS